MDDSLWAGANPINYGTGNASRDPRTGRDVGFAGGPQTASIGRERYGIEGQRGLLLPGRVVTPVLIVLPSASFPVLRLARELMSRSLLVVLTPRAILRSAVRRERRRSRGNMIPPILVTVRRDAGHSRCAAA